MERQVGDLSIDLRLDLPRPLVSVAGDLDLASVGLLAAMLDHARRTSHRRTGAVSALEDVDLDVDLTEVPFADSQGLAPMLDSRTRIVGASTAVRRLLLVLRDVGPLPNSPSPRSRPLQTRGTA